MNQSLTVFALTWVIRPYLRLKAYCFKLRDKIRALFVSSAPDALIAIALWMIGYNIEPIISMTAFDGQNCTKRFKLFMAWFANSDFDFEHKWLNRCDFSELEVTFTHPIENPAKGPQWYHETLQAFNSDPDTLEAIVGKYAYINVHAHKTTHIHIFPGHHCIHLIDKGVYTRQGPYESSIVSLQNL